MHAIFCALSSFHFVLTLCLVSLSLSLCFRFPALIGVSALRLIKVDVPGSVNIGDAVWLNCSYDLESDQLYSIKWYKNNTEFYRFLPTDNPPSHKYKSDGIYLDVSSCNLLECASNQHHQHSNLFETGAIFDSTNVAKQR